MRELVVVDVSDPRALQEPLHRALFEQGPAVLPRPGGAKLTATAPTEVDDDTAVVVETSGTTGAPKRVALGAEAILASAQAAVSELGAPGVWLQMLPAHYIAGIQVVARSLVSGTTPVVLHPQPFSSVAVAAKYDELHSVAKGAPTYTSMVPAQLHRILDDAVSMPVLHQMMREFGRILVGGQAIPAALLERALAAGYRVTRTYGSSETAGGCVWDQKPIGDVIVREIDGHLALSGSVVAHRYLDNPSRTAQSFVSHEGRRWYVSDDAGFVDEAGLVHVLGRLDDVIISGGVKVALGAIETVVRNTVAAHDAVVVAAPHDQWGHVPVVVTTQELDLATVRQVVHAALGAEARPHRIIVVSEIPLLSSGKPDRLGLTQLAKG